MKHAFTTLQTSLAFYLLVLLFPISIYYTNNIMDKMADDRAQISDLKIVQNMLHHLTHTPPAALKGAMISQVDDAMLRLEGERERLSSFDLYLDTSYKQLSKCWKSYKGNMSEPPHMCWKYASDAYNATEKAVAQSQQRLIDGLFLTLLASMIVAIAVIFIIRNQMKIQMERHSMYDKATRLFNRNYFEAEVRKLISLSTRHGHALSMLAISLDEYEAITSGVVSDKGERILATFGALIKSTIRESDIACRFDENLFIIITQQTDAAQASVLTGRLTEKCAATEPLAVTVGTVQYNGSESIDDFLGRAQSAMHEA